MKQFISKHQSLLIFFISLLLVTAFIATGQKETGGGFPLDDAWIHQTYARNLATSGQWSYTAGAISGGSTSPLWTLLIAAGDLISARTGLFLTFVFSIIAFSLAVWLAVKTFASLFRSSSAILFFATFVIASEWHLLWAAGSGMETTLYIAVIMALFFLLSENRPKWAWISILIGLIIWIRPDGITLLGPILLVFLARWIKKKETPRSILAIILPFICLLAAYFVFNLSTTGSFFPSTFYAKQQEYSILWAQPLLTRIGREIMPILTGTGVILFPGFIAAVIYTIKNRSALTAGIILWILGTILIYAIRLPVTYQHGRYIMPVIGPYLLISLVGMFWILQKMKIEKWQKLSQFTWVTLTLCTAVVFFITGLAAYQEDVSLVDRLMVQPAQWVNQYIPTGKIIAVHDIGAMGYFSDHPLIDLAGLANPEVIPFMRDEEKLHHYILKKRCAYYVGFSDWYQTSNEWGRVIHSFRAIYQDKQQTVVIIDLQ
jgi:hypothetical protein